MSTYEDCGWDEKTQVHVGALPRDQVEAVYRAAKSFWDENDLDPRLVLSDEGRALVNGLAAFERELSQ